jgi:hypothetical protein
MSVSDMQEGPHIPHGSREVVMEAKTFLSKIRKTTTAETVVRLEKP